MAVKIKQRERYNVKEKGCRQKKEKKWVRQEKVKL